MEWLVLVSGWVVAAVGWGMWLENRLWMGRVDWVPRAPNAAPPGVEGDYEPLEVAAERQLLKMDREKWVVETMNEAGVRRDEAERQVDEILAELGLS